MSTGEPTGTVVFLFTDIEGSTRLWESNPTEMRSALEQHDRLLRDCVADSGGYVFSTAGDAFSIAFGTVESAVRAACEAQDRLAAAAWPTPSPIRVRMGVHIGTAHERNGDYYGPVLNRTARIMSAGHGGQTLCSAAVAALATGVTLRPLGQHRLKDLQEPEELFQLGEHDFPPLRSLDQRRHNLPVQQTALIGRERQIGEIAELLEQRRLVTLTGVGGAGKTRLALSVGAELAERFSDGVFFAPLAAVSDPRFVASAVAEALGMTVGSADQAAVARFISSRDLLVVIDNCEHLIDKIAELIDETLVLGPHGRILATSREALDLDGEQVYPVPPLDAQGEHSPALQLLLERAQDARADFTIDASGLSAAADVCARLDGIPLAIELAATQLAHLSANELAERLDDRFRLLVGGRRRRLQRQHTLQAMMDWSWELLDADERAVLAQLSVFSGGWTLAAAEGICRSESGAPTAVLLQALAAKSLVVPNSGNGRYRMLETVRLYAQQKLLESGTTITTRDRHAAFYVDRADQMGPADRWLDIRSAVNWGREADNIQTVLDWLNDQNRLNQAAALVTMPALLWRGPILASQQHQQWIDQLLKCELDPGRRALVLVAAAEAAWGHGNVETMRTTAHEAASLARGVDNNETAVAALILEGITVQGRDPDLAETLLAEAAQRSATAGHVRMRAAAWAMAAGVESLGRGDVAAARQLVERALPDTDPFGFDRGIAQASISTLEVIAGNWAAALPPTLHQHEAFRTVGYNLGWIRTVELAVMEAETGQPSHRTLARAVDELRAAGGTLERPDLLMIPLGHACRNGQWRQAADIITSIRAAAKTGLSFASPLTTAYYLRYRTLITPELLHTGTTRPLEELITEELAQQP